MNANKLRDINKKQKNVTKYQDTTSRCFDFDFLIYETHFLYAYRYRRDKRRYIRVEDKRTMLTACCINASTLN